MSPQKLARACLGTVAILACSCLTLAAPSAAADELRIGGTGNALGAMRLIAAEFSRAQPRHKVEVLVSIGSSGGIRAVPKGAIQIGLSSRLPRADEGAEKLTTIEYARTSTVFTVREASPVRTITRREVADIYAGRTTAWPDGERIRLVMRQPGDDNTQQIAGLDTAIAEALKLAEKRPGLSFASNDQEAADKLESVQGSFGTSTVGLIRAEGRRLRALALDGIEPTPQNVQAGRYPLIKRLYLILPAEPTPAAREFVAFVQSPAGRGILERTGHTIP